MSVAAHFANEAEFHALSDAIGIVGKTTIWQWLFKYGWAALLQILPIILSGAANNLTAAQLIAWGEAALASIAAGQPLPAGPPLP